MVRSAQSGQILLVVVLAMIVALTVGLSIAARIVTELKLSKQNEESQRAFQAAEAGIQQTLERGSPVGTLNLPQSLDNNSFFSTTFTPDTGPAIVMNNGQDVDQAVGADVWLSNYSPDPLLLFGSPMGSGSAVAITMYWGSTNQTSCASTGDVVAPAVEVVLLRLNSSGNPIIEKSLYESAGCLASNRLGTTDTNSVTQGTTPVAPNTPKIGFQFRNQAPLRFGGASIQNGLIMKVIPIFNSTIVGFSSGTTFPAQGSIVESTGSSGDTVRKVVYYQSFPQMPLEVFPYSLLSQ